MKIRLEKITTIFSPTTSRGQRGMALVFSLVVLLILTILGISSLRTSSLEQLMSGNTQEQTRAFEAADSGLSRALNAVKTSTTTVDPIKFFSTNNTPYPYQTPSGVGTESSKSIATVSIPTGPAGPLYDSLQPQIGPAPRSSTPSGSIVCAAYYDQSVAGTTNNTLAQVNLHQGLITGAPCPTGP